MIRFCLRLILKYKSAATSYDELLTNNGDAKKIFFKSC